MEKQKKDILFPQISITKVNLATSGVVQFLFKRIKKYTWHSFICLVFISPDNISNDLENWMAFGY